MIKNIRCVKYFSTSAIKIVNKFDEDFYVKNYLSTFQQSGFPQATLKINSKTCNLIGVPRSGVQETMLDDMTELLLKDSNKTNFLIQMDPSPYLFAKRQLYKQYHSKVAPIISENLFEQLPILPIDTNELKLDYPIFDSLQLLKENPNPTNEQKVQLLGYLNGEQQGYYQQILQNLSELKNNGQELTKQVEETSDQMANKLADLLQSTLLYQDQTYMSDFSQLALFQSLYMTLLKGSKVHMIGLSQIYQRIYCGMILQLPELQQIFKEICQEALAKGTLSISYFFEFQSMLWKQKGIEYYLLYTINRYLKQTKEKEVTVIVDALHYDPLRIALTAQKNELIEEINNGYFAEFSYPKPEKQEDDPCQIEKQAILDCLLEQRIWNDPCIKNPYPYLSVDYNKLNQLEQKEIQQLFHKHYTKYSTIMQEIKKKAQEENKEKNAKQQ